MGTTFSKRFCHTQALSTPQTEAYPSKHMRRYYIYVIGLDAAGKTLALRQLCQPEYCGNIFDLAPTVGVDFLHLPSGSLSARYHHHYRPPLPPLPHIPSCLVKSETRINTSILNTIITDSLLDNDNDDDNNNNPSQSKVDGISNNNGNNIAIEHKVSLGSCHSINDKDSDEYFIDECNSDVQNIKVLLYDCAGSYHYRYLLQHITKDRSNFIFVIDAANRSRFEEAKRYFDYMLDTWRPESNEGILLIWANKMDMEDAMTLEEIKEGLELERLTDPEWNTRRSKQRKERDANLK